jgi:hypothetical protein
MAADGAFSGIWRDSMGKKSVRVELKPSTQTGLVGFLSLHFKYSVLAQANFPQDPATFCEQTWLMPNVATKADLIAMDVVNFLKNKTNFTPKTIF